MLGLKLKKKHTLADSFLNCMLLFFVNFYSCTRYELLCSYDSSSSSVVDFRVKTQSSRFWVEIFLCSRQFKMTIPVSNFSFSLSSPTGPHLTFFLYR